MGADGARRPLGPLSSPACQAGGLSQRSLLDLLDAARCPSLSPCPLTVGAAVPVARAPRRCWATSIPPQIGGRVKPKGASTRGPDQDARASVLVTVRQLFS